MKRKQYWDLGNNLNKKLLRQKSTFICKLPGGVGSKGESGALSDFGGRAPGTSAGLNGGFCGDIRGGDTSGAAYSQETKYNQKENNK